MTDLSKHRARLSRLAAYARGPMQRNPNDNLYHACIQKSASQWIKAVLRDAAVYRHSGLKVYDPDFNFLKTGEHHQLKIAFPTKRIISPLYITYDDFTAMPKPDEWKTVWIMRDPRDVICSKYFSIRYSHPVVNPRMAETRERFAQEKEDESLMHLIRVLEKPEHPQKRAVMSWLSADDPRVLRMQYEELTGEMSRGAFTRLFTHFDITLDDTTLDALLQRYSFAAMSRGRSQGEEDTQSHYRKGVAGDWPNHFQPQHVDAFKHAANDMLTAMGYEKDDSWGEREV